MFLYRTKENIIHISVKKRIFKLITIIYFEPTVEHFYAIGRMFNGPNRTNHLGVWSHWLQCVHMCERSLLYRSLRCGAISNPAIWLVVGNQLNETWIYYAPFIWFGWIFNIVTTTAVPTFNTTIHYFIYSYLGSFTTAKLGFAFVKGNTFV